MLDLYFKYYGGDWHISNPSVRKRSFGYLSWLREEAGCATNRKFKVNIFKN